VETPKSFQNVIWFEDVRGQFCKKCHLDNQCISCKRKDEGEVVLIQNVKKEYLLKAIRNLGRVKVENLSEALTCIGIKSGVEILNQSRLRYLEQKYQCHIFIYAMENEEMYAVRKPRKNKFSSKLNILLADPYPDTLHGAIENFSIILDNALLPKIYTCNVTVSCKYQTLDWSNWDKHVKICAKSSEQNIKCKQRGYGGSDKVIQEMIQCEILPKEAIHFENKYLATWDIETMEQTYDICQPSRGTVTEAKLNLLSLAVGSNIPGSKAKCWIRRNSDAMEELRLIKNFVAELDKIWSLKQKNIPPYIYDAYDIINAKKMHLKMRGAKWTAYFPLQRYKRALNNLTKLDVFGFNSSRFDVPCVAAPLLIELANRSKLSILKKSGKYFAISSEKFNFKDALNFTSPCTYERFARVWGAPSGKSIWPYSLFNSVEEIKSTKKFPHYSQFQSKLNPKRSPSMHVYIEAKREFYRRKLLPKNHSERISSMLGWLRYYNLQDVSPFASALENCFACYNTYFDVDPLLHLSLPALAQEAMFANYEPNDPLIYSFAEKNKDINDIFRNNVYGGLVNAYKRHIITFDKPGVPREARYAPNGNPYTTYVMLDFTSMYLSCQQKEMPTSPGIHWEMQNDGNFVKKIMTSGHSFKAQQWLTYLQATGYVL